MKNLQVDCFGGTTFHVDNDIEARIKTGTISIQGKYIVHQSNPSWIPSTNPAQCQYLVPTSCLHKSDQAKSCSMSIPKKSHRKLPLLQNSHRKLPLPQELHRKSPLLQNRHCKLSPPQKSHYKLSPPQKNHCKLFLNDGRENDTANQQAKTQLNGSEPPKLHAISLPTSSVIYPNDYLEIPLPKEATSLNYVSITPSFQTAYDDSKWQPQICRVLNGRALFHNYYNLPLVAKKFSHFRPNLVTACELTSATGSNDRERLPNKCDPTNVVPNVLNVESMINAMIVNKSVMSSDQLSRLKLINLNHLQVFDGNLKGGYNHKSGQFYADFIFSNKPPPTKVFVPQYNRKCSDLQQAKCDELEAQGVLVDPKLHDISVLHVSPSWIQQKGRAKDKNLQDCSLDELRFITAFNTLNDSIRPKPTKSCSSNAIFLFLARWKHHIFGDFNNSYFQLHVKKSLWAYLGIMTPYKGTRVLTRAGQGLLGSDVELEQLVSRVLGDDITQGYCLAIRDDIIIGGNSVDEALSNYESILTKLKNNNLKLSPHKIRVFPSDTEIYGYRIVNGCISPSAHIVTALGETKMEKLTTNKQVNSWKGLYKTLSGHLPALSNIMSPFDSATAGRNSSDKFVWTPTLTAAFNEAMNHLSQINKTYLPTPEEQLLLLPDAMSTSPCVGWVLYVSRNDKLLPVTFCTAKLKEYMTKWYPCEKEAMGVVLSIEQCAHWINESNLPTMVGPDSLAVVKATEKIRRGGHSTNPRLQSLLASINRRNIRFFHNSAKAGRHLVPDHLSRMVDSTCNSKDCAIERFLEDIPKSIEAMCLTNEDNTPSLQSLALSSQMTNPTILAASSSSLADQLLTRSGPIPLGSRQIWMSIQKSDPSCLAVFSLKTLGELPRKKGSTPFINRIHKESVIHQGLLMVKSFDNRKMREVLKVVVPPTFLDSILTIIHIRLNHPKKSQLKLVFNRYFFSPKTDAALDSLYSSCHTCISLMKLPKEMEIFNPSQFPDHPGMVMNSDILKRAGQLILITMDLFSQYTTACFSPSEKSQDLADAIIQTVTPIRCSPSVLVRVDKSPGLTKLAADNNSILTTAGISLELGNDENKNSNCSVDKMMNELEAELRKLSPSGEKINSSDLARAVMSLNCKIRNRGLSASEIHFARDSYDHSNLALDDHSLSNQQKELRIDNQRRLTKSRTPNCQPPTILAPEKGDIVFLKANKSKHTARDPHLVTDTVGQKSIIRKTIHTHYEDDRPLSLATKPKVVENKFLFKPSIYNRSTHFSPDPESCESIVHLPPINPPTEEWLPIISDDKWNSLITLTQHDCLPENEDPESINVSQPPSPIPAEILPHEDLHNFAENQEDIDTPTDSISGMGSNDALHEESPCNTDSTASSSPIRTFNPDESPFLPEKLDQSHKPKVGDYISFFDSRLQHWVDAQITANLSTKWKNYYNIIYEDGTEDGLYLVPDTRWTFKDTSNNTQETERYNINEITSVEPTPETTPTENVSLDDIYSNQLTETPGATLSTSSSSCATIHDLDATRDDSLEWDLQGIELHSSSEYQWPVDLHRVVNLDQLEPFSVDPPISTQDSLNDVVNLNNRLPLSSTPRPHSTRLSQLRRPLPLEMEENQGVISAFLRRLNPFKKRN